MERKKTLYLCGAITCDPNYKRKFENKSFQLLNTGYDVINPIDLTKIFGVTEWIECMKVDIRAMVLSDGIALIPSNFPSKGRDLELYIAKKLNIEIKTVDEWLALGKGVLR